MHITVLMAVFNEIETIKKSIDTILKQTYKDWDLIVVDDHYRDGTYDFLLQIAENNKQITVLRNERNIGLAASLNRGLKQSKGEMIARMDADDECYPERLEKQVDFMQKHPEIDVLGTGAELIGKDGNVQNRILLSEKHEQIKKDIFKKTLFFHPSVMMKKSFLKELRGYDEKLIRGQDFELWVKGIKKGYKYHNLQEVLLKYKTNDYSRPLKGIKAKFLTQITVSFRYAYILRGLSFAVINLFKSLLIYYKLYRPKSIKGIN